MLATKMSVCMRLVVQKVVLLSRLSFYVGWEEVTVHDIAWSKSSLSH